MTVPLNNNEKTVRIKTESLDAEDVITASGGLARTITDGMQTLIEKAAGFFNSLSGNPEKQ